MPQLDAATFAPQLIWLAITFILLYGLMAWVALPKIGRVIDQRRTQIETDLHEAQRMRTEAHAVLAAYERALAEARAQAQATIRETLDRLTAESAERQRQAASRLAEETAAAEARVAAARSAALENVRSVAIEIARAIAGKLAGAESDEVHAGGAVDAVLKERA
jgi:F-type H+-transporting ATPase subunit b